MNNTWCSKASQRWVAGASTVRTSSRWPVVDKQRTINTLSLRTTPLASIALMRHQQGVGDKPTAAASCATL